MEQSIKRNTAPTMDVTFIFKLTFVEHKGQMLTIYILLLKVYGCSQKK